MSARCHAAGSVMPGSELESMRVERWWGHGSFRFESASRLVRNTYSETVEDVVPDVQGSLVSGLVEEDND